MCLETQDCAILSRGKLTLREPASALAGCFSAVTAGAQGRSRRGQERQSSRSFGSCRKLKLQLVPGSYRRTRKPSGSHAIFRQKPPRSSPLCHSTSSTGEMSCRLSNFPQKPCGVSATPLFPEDIPRQGWSLPFQTQGDLAKLHSHRFVTGETRTLCASEHQDPEGSILGWS